MIRKLKSHFANPIQYSLPIITKEKEEYIPLNEFIGKTLTLTFTGQIQCIHCYRPIKKSFQQGYCFPCAQSLARCDICIVRPERCHYHLGTCREPDWSEKHCRVSHILYLAQTSDLKVGITREAEIPTRFIDQGAIQALPLLRVSTRFQAGLIEVAFAKWISDKTNWRKMLSSDIAPMDLKAKREELLKTIPLDEIAKNTEIPFEYEILSMDSNNPKNTDLIKIQYPVLQFPASIKSLSFDKTPSVSGILLGIKGQYLIFEQGVINMRNYAGYTLRISSCNLIQA